MNQKNKSTPEPGNLVPPFTLKDLGGRDVSPWNFKSRKNIVIVFFDPNYSRDIELLSKLSLMYEQFKEENTELLAIGRGSIEDIGNRVRSLNLPYILLADPYSETWQLYGVTTSTLFVADRFGELILQHELSGDVESLLNTILDRLGLAELQCPECGVPTWD